MRINLYLANVLGISRRAADREIESGNVRLGEKKAVLGDQVNEGDKVTYKGKPVVVTRTETTTIMLHKR
jgi:23S rRNA pseudouridine2604 synthase